jgi:hypothetical protein
MKLLAEELTKPEYMDDSKNKLLVNRVTKLYQKLYPEK